MAVLKSTAAFDTSSTSTVDQRPSATRNSSASSASSNDAISYTAESSDGDASKAPPPVKTTRQRRDYRAKSTFWQKKWSEMTWAERLCHLATCPPEIHELKEESLDRGPIPTQSTLLENSWILSRALIPIVTHSFLMFAFGIKSFPMKAAYPLYALGMVQFMIGVVRRLDYYVVKYGAFDEKQIGRDRTPDHSVNRLAKGIALFVLLRTAGMFYLKYDRTQNPLMDFEWTFPLRLMLWEVVFDYAFYVYHRTTHEFDYFWDVHQHHHTTKHPTPILSILAENRQECLEIVFCPLFATLLVPMSFPELFVTGCYTVYVEMLGHSGVRAHWAHPVLWWLRAFDAELAVEDHDLHHRFGKSGRNYGKQTRLWDRIFGTVTERIETYGM